MKWKEEEEELRGKEEEREDSRKDSRKGNEVGKKGGRRERRGRKEKEIKGMQRR